MPQTWYTNQIVTDGEQLETNPLADALDACGVFPTLGEGGRVIARDGDDYAVVRGAIEEHVRAMVARRPRLDADEICFCVDDLDDPTVICAVDYC